MTATAPTDFLNFYKAELESWDAENSTARLWKRESALWTGHNEDAWLGWLDAPNAHVAAPGALERQVRAAVPAGTTDVLLIGMGGSSLGPEVIARTMPRGASGATLRVLDSTDPDFVRDAFAKTNWAHTLIVAASKSGSTLEPEILLSAALDAARATLGDVTAQHVVAITDPGSHLFSQAELLGFAETFPGEPGIGGRYSVLSPFGLVPAALHGLDVGAFLESARAMAAKCQLPVGENPGVALGVFLATAMRANRDKCTLVLSPSLAPLGAWIEQLVAESTCKMARGIFPIDGETLGTPANYADDRTFVYIRDTREPDSFKAQLDALVAAGNPVFTIDVASPSELAGEFFRWEFATAVAASIIGVNPFDQPDVEASKVATRALTDALEQGTVTPRTGGNASALGQLFSTLVANDYVALLAFLPMFPDVVDALHKTRMRIRDARRVATSVGFGPRYLHSTGQAFKGGPNTGVFVQLTHDVGKDLAIPGRRATFGGVLAAQAEGDRHVLRSRHRRSLHIHLRGDLTRALADFDAAVAAALAAG